MEPMRKDDYYKYAVPRIDEDYERVMAGFEQIHQGKSRDFEEVAAELGKKYFEKAL